MPRGAREKSADHPRRLQTRHHPRVPTGQGAERRLWAPDYWQLHSSGQECGSSTSISFIPVSKPVTWGDADKGWARFTAIGTRIQDQDLVLEENQVEIWSEVQPMDKHPGEAKVPLGHQCLARSPRPTPCPGRRQSCPWSPSRIGLNWPGAAVVQCLRSVSGTGGRTAVCWCPPGKDED